MTDLNKKRLIYLLYAQTDWIKKLLAQIRQIFGEGLPHSPILRLLFKKNEKIIAHKLIKVDFYTKVFLNMTINHCFITIFYIRLFVFSPPLILSGSEKCV